MSRTMFAHSFVPGSASLSPASIDDRLRPGLQLAYPLPRDNGGDAFQRLLDALAQRTGGERQAATV